MRKILVCTLSLGVLSLTGCSEEPARAPRPAPKVSVMTVAPRSIPVIHTFTAQTESSRQVNIVSRVSGFLETIAYREGAMVREGDVLFQLDPRPFQAQLDASRGELQAQQARLSTAKATLERVAPLTRQNALSPSDLDRAQGEHDAAVAAVFSAQAKVKEAELNLGYTTIRSPLTGMSGSAAQRQGAYVNAATQSAALTQVAAMDPIWARFSVSQNLLAMQQREIAAGRVVPPARGDYEVELTLPDGRKHASTGRISFADPSFNPDTGAFLVRAAVPNPTGQLRPGMFVTATVRGATRPNAIVLPQLAVRQGQSGHFVSVVKEDGTAETRPVVVGDYVNEREIVILSGLSGGDRVVTEGGLRVVPGKPVEVSAAGGEPAAAQSPTPTGKSSDPAKR